MLSSLNERLRDDVLAEIDQDPKVNAARVGVAVDDGVVTLTGTVSSLAQKWAVEDAVKRVKGVHAIAEEIEVDLPSTHRRDDTDVARAVADAIAWDSLLPRDIQATVQDAFQRTGGSCRACTSPKAECCRSRRRSPNRRARRRRSRPLAAPARFRARRPRA